MLCAGAGIIGGIVYMVLTTKAAAAVAAAFLNGHAVGTSHGIGATIQGLQGAFQAQAQMYQLNRIHPQPQQPTMQLDIHQLLHDPPRARNVLRGPDVLPDVSA